MPSTTPAVRAAGTFTEPGQPREMRPMTTEWTPELFRSNAAMGRVVADVEIACDTIECGYRIVRLVNGQHAFVWGNIRSEKTNILPEDTGDGSRGYSLHATYEDAIEAYRDCAEALSVYSERMAEEMLAVL